MYILGVHVALLLQKDHADSLAALFDREMERSLPVVRQPLVQVFACENVLLNSIDVVGFDGCLKVDAFWFSGELLVLLDNRVKPYF